MNIGISGTYSSGKTLTTMALSHYTGLPRTQALTMREILPDAVPGKSLAECSAAEFVQLVVRRHTERAVHERLLDGAFVSDGCSLQEWSYGTARVVYGIDPAATADGAERPRTAETEFFAEVFVQLGHAFQQHVRATYDVFVHLRNELPMRADGHRPMNDRFRTTCDGMILSTLNRLGLPAHVVGGGLTERLWTIAGLLDLRPVMPAARAIELAEADYGRQDLRFERDRAGAAR